MVSGGHWSVTVVSPLNPTIPYHTTVVSPHSVDCSSCACGTVRLFPARQRAIITLLCFSSSVIFLLVDACLGLNWLLVSFLSHVNKNIIHSFIHAVAPY